MMPLFLFRSSRLPVCGWPTAPYSLAWLCDDPERRGGRRHLTEREICRGKERGELLARSFLDAEKHEHRDFEQR